MAKPTPYTNHPAQHPSDLLARLVKLTADPTTVTIHFIADSYGPRLELTREAAKDLHRALASILWFTSIRDIALNEPLTPDQPTS